MAVGTPRVVAIVQARMGSSRLPGKVLADIEGEPMLVRVIQRLQRCKRIQQIVVATTRDDADILVYEMAKLVGVPGYRHQDDPGDVLGRYVAAARRSDAGIVVRVTADCPLIDSGTVDRLVGMLLAEPRADYASNVIERTYPDGLDVEAFWFDTLLRMDRHATEPADREHVTRVLLRSGQPLFTVLSLTTAPNRSRWRWTVDTEADLEYVRKLYRAGGLADHILPYEDVATLIEASMAPCRWGSDEPRRTLEAAAA